MFIELYKGLLRASYPLFIKPYINKRKKNGKEDLSRFNERMGLSELPRPKGKLVWFHGASVGESVSMLPLIQSLLEQFPDTRIMVTTGTVTSAEIMGKRLPEKAFHQYIPIDHPDFVKRFLNHWQPDAALWFESDFWPSMLSEIKKRHIPLLLVNGRISDRSFRRWQRFPFFIRELLNCFTFCLGQSEEDVRRLKILGAPKAECSGNIKYAGLPLPCDSEKLNRLKQQIGGRPVWLASSTHNNEEEQIGTQIHKIAAAVPNILTIIAPRHPQRGKEIKETLEKMQFHTALRSAGETITDQTDIYIADTIGEMGLWYTLCPLVFIGGSLIPHGGQNFIEPSRMNDAVCVGPHMHNFADVINRAQKAGAVARLKDVEELGDFVTKLLTSPETLQKHQQLAFAWAQSENKVLEDILNKITGYISQ